MARRLRFIGFVAVVAAAAAGSSCSSSLRESRAPVLLVVNSLQGAPTGGANANSFGAPLLSDVVVMLRSPAPCTDTSPCPTIYNDLGQADIGMVAKNQDVAPTPNNQVTISRYHVEYVRADGRNAPGVDVPYAFDGSASATIAPGGTTVIPFELVRHSAKLEAPLASLANNLTFIYTIAKVTFYGRDLAGNDVAVTGSVSVNFGNFADQ
jgi:hypothetical protein